MNPNPTPAHCSRCGADLPARLPGGLCPKCLLEAGLGTQPQHGPENPLVPPPPAARRQSDEKPATGAARVVANCFVRRHEAGGAAQAASARNESDIKQHRRFADNRPRVAQPTSGPPGFAFHTRTGVPAHGVCGLHSERLAVADY